MPMLTATLASFSGVSFLSQLSTPDSSIPSSISFPIKVHQLSFSNYAHKLSVKMPWYHASKVFVSGNTHIENPESGTIQDPSASQDASRHARYKSEYWKAAKAYQDSGSIYDGLVEGFNSGGLLVQFHSFVGFLPFPQMSPSHSYKEPLKTIQDIAKGLVGSRISVKVIQVDEDRRTLIFSERAAAWSKFSEQVKVGDVFDARVGVVEDYGAFVHLCFPDGLHHLTGLVHISEISWDLVQDVRDILKEGDQIKVKVINVDRQKRRIKLSIKQLEEDPLLETLDKVIPEDGSADPDSLNTTNSSGIKPLPGLDTILEELVEEDGIDDARISRQGFEKRVVSQDLQLWLSNAPPTNRRFTLLARAGRQVQEIHLITSLDQEGIKRALQRVLERVP
ncbi:hypothetical protein L6164_013574 [Bauhinia variegata]|uniref:Uncharacterized protein n=1 Tax=Bauhinia variegata TaxID=167791 RepID=A0ACB9NF38_BAUVA|nr:hypothetical protein L6164_013574 [Bauhinia variegata]